MWAQLLTAGATLAGGYMSSQAAKKAGEAQAGASADAINAQLEQYYQSRQDQMPWLKAGQYGLTNLMGGSYYRKDRPKVLMSDGTEREIALNYTADPLFQQLPPDQQAIISRQMDAYKKSKVNVQGMLAKGPGEFDPKKEPGYQFGYQELVNPFLSSQAAKGMRLSGQTLKGLNRYAQDYASTMYDNFLSRYYQSLTPFQSLAGVGQTTAAGVGQNAMVTGQGLARTQMYAGDAAGTSAINQANAWTNALQGGLNAYGMIYGSQPPPPPTPTPGTAPGTNFLANASDMGWYTSKF